MPPKTKKTPAETPKGSKAAPAKASKGGAAKGAAKGAAGKGKAAAPKTSKSTKVTKKGAPSKVAAKVVEKAQIWESKPRNYTIGNDIQPKIDVTRFTKWPRYVVLQRRKRVLAARLKVPPVINQFTNTLDTNTAANLFKLLNSYRPEDSAQKKKRLLEQASKESKPSDTKPVVVKHGFNHVTKLIEDKKAALVIIAHDVDPIELVLFLPALCRKNDIPYCIVKGKARLGQVVHQKTATVLALTSVRSEDRQKFTQLVTAARSQYNDRFDEIKKHWGGGKLGRKSAAVLAKRAKAAQKDQMDKLKYK